MNAVVLKICGQKMKFSINDFSSKCNQIRSFLRIWSHLLEKSLIENFIFSAVNGVQFDDTRSHRSHDNIGLLQAPMFPYQKRLHRKDNKGCKGFYSRTFQQSLM